MALLSASSHLTSILLWSILPSLASGILLRIFYTLSPSSQPRVPVNPSPLQVAHENHRAREHSRWARIVLVAGYLVWTLLSCYREQGGINSNYYTLLGIERELVEQEGASAVKSRWRRLARVYHPDKVGKEGEAFFVLLRRGVDVLENEGKRWGYERFGPDVVEWGKLVTNREFLVRGVQGSAAFYVFALGSIMTVSFFRKDERAYNFVRFRLWLLALFTLN
jgi:preprotein translocase subunit Sec63